MTEAFFILCVVVATALAFDFTNGFHDTANAMATSVATGALKPKAAVGLSAILNLVGAFLSIEVALTVSNKIISIQGPNGEPVPGLMGVPMLVIILSGLVGGILWNLVTWLFGLPSSSSHALFGGLIGATIAALGLGGIKWDGVITSIVLPALFAPVVAGLVAGLGTWVVFKLVTGVPERRRDNEFRWGQVGSASLVSLAHGTNDAQKTMGVITLALDRVRRLEQPACHSPVGEDCMCLGDRCRHLGGRLAGDPDSRQGTGGDRLAAGHGRRDLIGGDHPVVESSRHGPVHNAGRERLHPGVRGRPSGSGPVGRIRPHGCRLGPHAAERRDRRSAVLVRGQWHRRRPWCHCGNRHLGGQRRVHVPPVPPHRHQPGERQCRVGGRAGTCTRTRARRDR